ncbi:MAG TPA: wax ester/triacylglycerol synthase family O-acyltransferase [Solirubrobacteraceae bacterium]|nr:wax ester/triacylglycerol synthase family O-acyltransferase [Solirubrobacteraceae bacterium]
MANRDRLTALDAGFLHLERHGAHMHVAGVMVFEGEPPAYDELVEALEARMHLVPRYRQKLAHVPYGQGRPVWVDDPHFNLRYHVRHSALPEPGSDEQLRNLAGRLFALPLDRTKPLWEINLVEGLEGGRFALISKTHHALVDGVSGVDITSVLFDATPDPPAPTQPPPQWVPEPEPTAADLLAQALLERTTLPNEAARGVRALTRAPRRVLSQTGEWMVGVGAMAWAGVNPAPTTPLNVPIGPHRRYTWVDSEVARFKAIKNTLEGTLNDVVLSAVALALGRFLRRRGIDTDDLVLKVMVPVSVRAETERGALGNRVAAMWAPLPVGVEDPEAVLSEIADAMRGLKESGQAVGAQALTSLADFAPPTIMSQAARLQARQRYFNLVVTNVPGPQVTLYLLGRPMRALYPVVPLARNQALGIAIMSYDGRLGFGLLGDYDAMPDLEDLADDLRGAINELSEAAGLPPAPRPARKRAPEATRA